MKEILRVLSSCMQVVNLSFPLYRPLAYLMTSYFLALFSLSNITLL